MTSEAAAATERAEGDPDLPAACLAFRSGEACVDSLLAEISRAGLYLHRPGCPGVFVAALPDGRAWACAFSSLPRLAAAPVGGAEWYRTLGRDLLQQLPTDVGLLIDPGEAHVVALPPDWLARSGGEDERILS